MYTFDYKGESEERLLELCNTCDCVPNEKYWPATLYSFGRLIKEYGFYPQWLPLYVFTNHGVDSILCTEITEHDLLHDAYCQFYNSPSVVKSFKETSKIPCYNMVAPYVYYRKHNKIEKLPNAKGTLAYYAHNTPGVHNVSSVEDYIISLKNLPEEFQPVCVSLHMHDINQGVYKKFIEHNIPIYTAGNSLDTRFVDRFYDILKNFKYTTSNVIGSNTFYSVEMGIPFFIHGDIPKYYNDSNPFFDQGDYNFYNEQCKKIYKIFTFPQVKITPEQKEFVETNLGIYDGVSRIKMAQILYTAYIVTKFKEKKLCGFSDFNFENKRKFYLLGLHVASIITKNNENKLNILGVTIKKQNRQFYKYDELLDYLRRKNFQRNINIAAKKYNKKKILIYGCGLFFDVMIENFDISCLNIVAVSDKRFTKNTTYMNFRAVPVREMKNIDFDIMLLALYDPSRLCSEYFQYPRYYNAIIDSLNQISFKDFFIGNK